MRHFPSSEETCAFATEWPQDTHVARAKRGLSRQKHHYHADFSISMHSSGDIMLPETMALRVSRPYIAILSHSSNTIAVSQLSVKSRTRPLKGGSAASAPLCTAD